MIDHRLEKRYRVWAIAVRRYAARRLELAEMRLAPPAYKSFFAFCELWCGRFPLGAPSETADADGLRDLYLRFVRQCRSWEATLRINGRVRRALVSGQTKPSDSLRNRMRRLAERHERISGFYGRLAEKTESGIRSASLPWDVCEAYQVLRLPVGAPLNEVRSSYRRLAIQNHPDRRGDADAMAELSRAYRSIVDYYRPREGAATS